LGGRGPRLRWLALFLAVLGALIALPFVHPSRSSGHGSSSAATSVPPPPPGAREVLRRLSRRALRQGTSKASWQIGNVRVLTRRVAEVPWRFAYLDRGDVACWVLVVPPITNDGACATPSQLSREHILVSGFALPDRRKPSEIAQVVVYGLVSSRVHSLELTLSDCSKLAVVLASRPMFWAFVSPKSTHESVVPSGYVVRLQDGRVLRGTFPDVRAPAPKRLTTTPCPS
jgi:hypothetical protein